MKKKAFNNSINGNIITKINELYITERKTYLILNKSGNYSSLTKDKWGERYAPLHDGHIEKHLKGLATYGVFAGNEVSKFICFDIDMIDKDKLRWIYYILIQSLTEIGVNKKYIHIASSGNKGLHVLLFVQDGTSLKNFKSIFVEVMKLVQSKIEINTNLFVGNELKLEITDVCNIEFRPTSSQGVKLELGVNFKNPNNKTNKCSFVDKESLKALSNEYILSIQPMTKDDFLLLMEGLNDDFEEKVAPIKLSVKEPLSHKQNKDENVTIDYIVNLINNGLYMSGTRHNSILKIAKYFRYMGLELEGCIEELCKWMKWQDKRYYSISLEDAISECIRISKIVYEKEYSLVGHIENLQIHKNELVEIIKINNKNDKLLLFTMLIHSKRFALKNGVFYMTFKQIEQMCRIGDDGAKQSIKRLEESGILTVVSRNVRKENNYKHQPNRYKINLNVELNEVVLEIDNTSSTISYDELYYTTLINTFSNKELKHLPVRQYKELTQYRKQII